MTPFPVSIAILGVAVAMAATVHAPATASAGDETRDPHRHTRERVWPGYGGATLEHHFGMHPSDPERPRYRKYYPYTWGGYAFSAPYFVSRHDYTKPDYEKVPYGKAQKRRWGRDWRHEDRYEDGRW